MTSAAAGPPPIRVHDPALLFGARAARLHALADGHAAGDWLLFLSRVAAGQAAAVREVSPPAARAPGAGPPLAAGGVPRDGTWRRMLGAILSASARPGLPPETEGALRRLGGADPPELEALADAVLAGDVPPDARAPAPLVAAALQAWFAALAAGLDPARVAPCAEGCPVCGSPPVAGAVHGGDRLRYLSCALCAAEWNVPRLRCVVCGGEGELAYYEVEGDGGAKAEACGACGAYVKLFDEERRPGLEPAADDAATLALDLLVAEEGFGRAGTNLLVAAAARGR